jgi:RNA polymerase sigma-70 factor (ECF subfamily)
MALPPPATPRDEVERAEAETQLRARVREVLERINPRYRRAIELRLLEDRERQACADEMAVKLGTFDVLLLRAVRSFRAEWESLHRGEGEGKPGVAAPAGTQEEER